MFDSAINFFGRQKHHRASALSRRPGDDAERTKTVESKARD